MEWDIEWYTTDSTHLYYDKNNNSGGDKQQAALPRLGGRGFQQYSETDVCTQEFTLPAAGSNRCLGNTLNSSFFKIPCISPMRPSLEFSEALQWLNRPFSEGHLPATLLDFTNLGNVHKPSLTGPPSPPLILSLSFNNNTENILKPKAVVLQIRKGKLSAEARRWPSFVGFQTPSFSTDRLRKDGHRHGNTNNYVESITWKAEWISRRKGEKDGPPGPWQ